MGKKKTPPAGRGPAPGAARSDPMERALALTDLGDVVTDPNGSYTGQPLDRDAVPVQDADDL